MRENKVLENIAKLKTFIHMTKSNELLTLYIEKITNNKSKNLKFVNDFDYIALDLLYTSLQIMNSNNFHEDEYNKIDKKELKFHLDKTKGINYFKNQVPSIKDNESLISYLMKALASGSYICNHNSTVRFDNGLIVDSDWLVDFSRFLVTSFNNNKNVSIDGKRYYFNVVLLPETNSKNYLRNVRLYEYDVKRKDNKRLTYDNVKYLINTLSIIDDYDFKELKDINSRLSKDGFVLSVNKKNPIFNKENKKQINKFLNEDGYEFVLAEYIKNTLKCYNSDSESKRRELINTYELLLDLSRAYKCNYTLEECRKLFDLNHKKEEINKALSIANFYINYIYDETSINRHFNYATLNIDKVKPSIIDYETTEYKDIIKKLSNLNKRMVDINRKININLNIARVLNKKDKEAVEENSSVVYRYCKELEKTIEEIKLLREELEDAKDENHEKNNVNKTKIKYIKESIISGTYTYDPRTTLLVFDVYSKKDYHRAFHLDISLSDFNDIILSEENRNQRINFYQI